MALCDMITPAIILPISIAEIINPEKVHLCTIQYFFGQASVYIYSMLTMVSF